MHPSTHAGVIEPHSKCYAESHKKASNVERDPFGLGGWGAKTALLKRGLGAKTALLGRGLGTKTALLGRGLGAETALLGRGMGAKTALLDKRLGR